MSDRRKLILVSVFVAMAALTLGDRLFTAFYQQPLADAEEEQTRLRKQIIKAKQELKELREEAKQLDQARSSSLPADITTARTLYQGWLTDLVEEVQLASRQIDSNPPRMGDGYSVLPFSMRGTGTLEQLTALLYSFYRSPHLHQLRTLTITPLTGSRQLSLNLAIEAISIDGTKRSDSLAAGTADVLASEDLDDYRMIARRNILSASGGVEATEHTVLTAIVSVDDTTEAWFTNRLEDRVEKLCQHDQFWVGTHLCEIKEIARRDVVIEADGERWLLTIHDRIADATALPPEF